MKIISAKACIKNLALSKPYVIASKTITDVENVFLEILLEDGTRGIGACNPDEHIVDETNAAALVTLEEKIIPHLLGKDILLFQQLIAEIAGRLKAKPGSLAATDIALHDAFALHKGIAVAEIYGRHISCLPTSYTIGIMPVQQAMEEAKAIVANGFTVIKIKTGLQVEQDIETVCKIREAVGKKIVLRVDANQGYTLAGLQLFLQQTAAVGIELVEQPMLPGKEDELRRLPEDVRKILCADESLRNAADAHLLAAAPLPYGIFNIKLMKCGGICEAMKIASVARTAGIRLFWGCNDESIVSITAALHAAFACTHTRYIDLDGSLDLAEDMVSGGFILKDGVMHLTPNKGLGVKHLFV